MALTILLHAASACPDAGLEPHAIADAALAIYAEML